MNEFDRQVISEKFAALTLLLINFIAHLDAQGVADARAFLQEQRQLLPDMAPERARQQEPLCDLLSAALRTPPR